MRWYTDHPIEASKITLLREGIGTCNRQKFEFILSGAGIVEAKPRFTMVGYGKIDLGIAKCHFELGAGKDNFAWK